MVVVGGLNIYIHMYYISTTKILPIYPPPHSPESIKNRNDLFYLQPEPSCMPESPVWFSVGAVQKDALALIIARVKVKAVLDSCFFWGSLGLNGGKRGFCWLL